MRTPAWRLRGL